MTTAPAPGTAVFVFDSSGRRIAASADADALLGASIDSAEAFEARLRGDDGSAVRLDDLLDGDPMTAVGVDGRHLDVEADVALGSERTTPDGRLTIARVTIADDTAEAVVQRALGGVLAHELRTPLTTIYGGAQLLSAPGMTQATRREAAQTVAREAQRLHDIVEDLVVLARFDRLGADDLEPILLQHVLPELVESERQVRPQAVVEIALPADLPAVLANVRSVQHAFRNLLATSLAAGPRDGRVEIAGSAAPDAVTVRIVDDGPALGPDEAGQAFDLFGRTLRTMAGGSGVNVAAFVSRRLIEAMGGRIWATSRPAGGEMAFSLAAVRGGESLDAGATAL